LWCTLGQNIIILEFSGIRVVLSKLYFCIISEEECYNCLASLISAKEKVFITQTKQLYEVTWKTVMQIAKKHAVSNLR
jgi:hypothetical protein